MSNIKVVVVGDSGVGKTCCLITYTLNSFPHEYVPTVFDNYNHPVMVDGEIVTLGLWDVAAQEDYDRLRPLTYPGTDVFLVMFSHGSSTSLENVTRRWIPEINNHCPGVPFILVGSKNDLLTNPTFDGMQLVSELEGRNKATEINAFSFASCSALKQEGLTDLFYSVIRAARSNSGGSKGGIQSSSEDQTDSKAPFILPKFDLGPSTDEEELIKYLKGLIPNPKQADVGVDVSGRTFRSKIEVTIGQFTDAASSISLQYKSGSDAQDIISSLQLTNEATPLVCAVSFNVREGTNAFRLGELSGTIRDMLGLGLTKFKSKIVPTYNTDYDESRHLYTISFSIASAGAHDAIQDIIKFYQPQKINASVDFSLSPSQFVTASSSTSSSSSSPSSSSHAEEFIQARVSLETESARNVFKLLEGNLLSKNDNEKDQRMIGIFRSGRRVAFKLEFDDVAEFYKSAIVGEVPPFMQTLNWKSLQDSSVMMVEKLMGKKVPSQLREAYTKLTEYLTGLSAIHIVAGKENVVEIATHDLPLFTLLPNLQEMIAEKKRKKAAKKEEEKNGDYSYL